MILSPVNPALQNLQADKTKGSPRGKPFYNLYKYIRSSPQGKYMMMIMYQIDQHGPQN
jgi:hypothetical protein